MKKDLIFAPILVVIGAVLCMFKLTGLTAHIVISVIGVLALVAYAVLTQKEWKLPALEIGMRALYGIALISGIIIMNVRGIAAVAVVHKVSAILFFAVLIALLASKVIPNKNA